MFDLLTALTPLDGRMLTHKELMAALEEMHMKHLGEFSPETGARELFEIARQKGWLLEHDDGHIQVHIMVAA